MMPDDSVLVLPTLAPPMNPGEQDVGVTTDANVVIRFGSLIRSVVMTPEQAESLAEILKNTARSAREKVN